MSAAADTRAGVLSALDRVIDPCSVGRHLPAGLVEMGMVESVELADRGSVEIELQLTSPACHFQHWFAERVQTEVAAVEGVDSVSITWSTAFDWSDDKMSDSLKARMRERRVAARRARAEAMPGPAADHG